MIEKPNVYSRRVQKALRLNDSETALLQERLERIEAQRRLLVLRAEDRQRSLRGALRSIRRSTGTLYPEEPDPRHHAAVTLFLYGVPVTERRSQIRLARYSSHTTQKEQPGATASDRADHHDRAFHDRRSTVECSVMPASGSSYEAARRGTHSGRYQPPLRLPELPRSQPGFSVYYSEMPSVASSASPTPSAADWRKPASVAMPKIRRR